MLGVVLCRFTSLMSFRGGLKCICVVYKNIITKRSKLHQRETNNTNNNDVNNKHNPPTKKRNNDISTQVKQTHHTPTQKSSLKVLCRCVVLSRVMSLVSFRLCRFVCVVYVVLGFFWGFQTYKVTQIKT